MDWHIFFNAISDPAMVLDLNQRILEVNAKTIAITGMSSDQLKGRFCYKVFHGQAQPPAECPFKNALNQQKAQECAMAVEVMDKTFRVSLSPLFNASGEVEKILHIARDITKQLEAESALKKSEEKYRLLVENSDDVHYRVDHEGHITYISRSVKKITGYSVDDVMGRNMGEAYVNLRDREELNNLLKKQGFAKNFTAQLKRKDGSIWWGSANCHLLKDRRDLVIGVEGSCRDTTQLKMSEIFLKRSKEHFRILIEQLPAIFYTAHLDSKSTTTYVSPQIEKILGFTPQEYLANPDIWAQQLHPEDRERVLSEVAQSHKKGEPFSSQYRMLSKTGEVLWFKDHAVIIKDDDGKPSFLQGLMFDLTQKIQTEKELLKIKKLESVGVLAGGIAHDFNNILAAILGNISLALSWTEPNDKIYELLQESEKASLRAKNLTHQLLTFAKGGEPIRKTASIEDVLKDSTAFVLSGSKSSSVFSFSEPLKPVSIDSNQISQVVRNLIINASQAMPNGGIITISGHNCKGHKSDPFKGKHPEFIKITFKDQGVGIPLELLEQIFDPYFTTKPEGSGLGLAITHSIIVKHGGHLQVASQPEQGAEFTIYLPAVEDDLPLSQPAATAKVTATSARIMIMDDEEMIRNLVVKILSRKGYQTIAAVDGAEAIKFYEESLKSSKPIDLVIMDLTIPGGMGGKEAVTELLKIDPQARVIISSGYANDPIMANYKEYGFMAAVNKPFQIKDLLAAINEALNGLQ